MSNDPIERSKARDSAREPAAPAEGDDAFIARQNSELLELEALRKEHLLGKPKAFMTEKENQRVSIAQDRTGDCSRCGEKTGSYHQATSHKLCEICVNELVAYDQERVPGSRWWFQFLPTISKAASTKGL